MNCELITYLFDDIYNMDKLLTEDIEKKISTQRFNKISRYKDKTKKLLGIISYLMLVHCLNTEGKIVNGLIFSHNKQGKPYLKDYPGIFFNFSHCKFGVVCAISKQEIGVDIQNISQYNPKVLSQVLNLREQEMVENSSCPEETFFMLWTLKESYLKAIGTGLTKSMKTITFNIRGNKITSSKPNWSFMSFREKDYVVSVCSKEKINDLQYIRVSTEELNSILK